MKKTLFFLACSLFLSCEKVIELELNEADERIVIEGAVTDRPGPYLIQISKTVSFTAPNVFPAVTNAAVTIADNLGFSETLTHNGNGTYATTSLQGIPGRTYTLTVSHAGETYSASATMPQPVDVDLIYTYYDSLGFIGIPGYYAISTLTDPPGAGNRYRIRIYRNNTMTDDEKKTIRIRDDKFTDGLQMTNFFYSTVFQAGDSVKVEQISLDPSSFEYFATLQATLNNNSSQVPPDNPITNLTNGALGYFGAHAVKYKSALVQ